MTVSNEQYSRAEELPSFLQGCYPTLMVPTLFSAFRTVWTSGEVSWLMIDWDGKGGMIAGGDFWGGFLADNSLDSWEREGGMAGGKCRAGITPGCRGVYMRNEEELLGWVGVQQVPLCFLL